MITEFFAQTYGDLGIPAWLFTIVIVWSLVWKGLALWKSARKNQSIWFIILLVVNTIGILEILYIFVFSEIKLDKKLNRKKIKKTARKTNKKFNQKNRKGIKKK